MKFKLPMVELVVAMSAILLIVTPVAAPAAPMVPLRNGQYRLRLFHPHTGEKLDVVYRNGDSYVPDGLAALDHFLRDYRNGEVHHYDPRLFDLLYELLDSAGRPGS